MRFNDFSIATIARLGYKRGVPKNQSLRNKTGENYRALRRSFDDENTGNKPQLEARAENDWRALDYLISEQFLAKWQFSISEYGEIVEGNNNLVLEHLP